MKVGIVKVTGSSSGSCWYKHCIGKLFHVIQYKKQDVLWFTPFLFFFPQDIEVVEDNSKEALVYQYLVGLA